MKLGDILSMITHVCGIGLSIFGIITGNHDATNFGVGLAGGSGIAAHLPVTMFQGGEGK